MIIKNIDKKEIKLIPVMKKDFLFLFELLKERKPHMNISHKKMPTYSQHVRFILSKPYKKWYIIKIKNESVGSIYLSYQDEIGIFILQKFQRLQIGKEVIKLLMEKNPRKRYLANINPKNKKSIKFFKEQNFELIQYTYELMTRNNEKK